jgi:hypothetical protein
MAAWFGPAPRHDRDAGGPADVLAVKAALQQEVWSDTHHPVTASA